MLNGFSQTLQGEKGPGYEEAVATELHRQLVATALPLDTNLPRYPPNSRMVEEQGFHQDLEDIGEEVMAPYVGQFMGQEGFQMVDTQPCAG
jgi:hypothetical protein